MYDGKSGCWTSERKTKVGERRLRPLKNECYVGAENRDKIMPCIRLIPRTISVKFLPKDQDGQGTKCRRNIAKNFNRLSRAHERYRRQTDRRQTDGRQHYSERKLELTFAKTAVSHSGFEARGPSSVGHCARAHLARALRRLWHLGHA